jgi:uncharacterized protein YkwD
MSWSARPLPFLVVTLILLFASPVQAIDLNGYRKANGLQPMSAHVTLTALAKAHAADMAGRGTMDHAGFYEVRAPRGARAENVAYGCADANCAMQQWIGSSPHRVNMLRPDFTRYGLGSAVSASGQRFWALELGK